MPAVDYSEAASGGSGACFVVASVAVSMIAAHRLGTTLDAMAVGCVVVVPGGLAVSAVHNGIPEHRTQDGSFGRKVRGDKASMTYDLVHHRRPFDCTTLPQAGAYFATICVEGRSVAWEKAWMQRCILGLESLCSQGKDRGAPGVAWTSLS